MARAREAQIVLSDQRIAVSAYSSICSMCRHYREGRSCDAYPDEDAIPMPIWKGESDHTRPYRGDHGIRFEKVP